MNIDSENFIQILFILVIAVGATLTFFVAALYLFRLFVRNKASLRSGQFKHITLRILIPKFQSDEDVKSDEKLTETQEDIAFAETFFAAIGGLTPQKGMKAWLYGRQDELALEIVMENGLITFYITAPEYLKEFVEQQLHAQYSNASIDVVEDYNIFSPTGTIVGSYLIFKRETALPIKTYKELESDPLNSLTNALSKVSKDDGLVIQYVARSARSSWRSFGLRIVKNMKKGMTFKEAKKGQNTFKKLFFTKKNSRRKRKAGTTETFTGRRKDA